ncbi:unnamed protein product [Rotaria sordida]|uniref:Uncharacterized protein n=1 Tax=Rotaria sordida TaxID=392033 RepID=A0A819RXH5_9BILA|nr:unnamed protein product [Rotaria sordida]CAF4053840.1 unnamed protein product [Rotaria sordida]
MLNFQRILLLQHSISFGINAHRFRSARRSSQSLSNDEKHIINETKPVSLDNLSSVVRQILSKDSSYAVRFGDDLILSTTEDEDKTIPSYETARCFGCRAPLQCADKTKPGFIPVEIYKHYLSTNLQKRTSESYKNVLTEIKWQRALIILIVDPLDIPNSISRS